MEVDLSLLFTKENKVGTAFGFSVGFGLVPGISSLFKSRSKQSSVKCSEHTRLDSLIGGGVFEPKLGQPNFEESGVL